MGPLLVGGTGMIVPFVASTPMEEIIVSHASQI